MTCIMNSNIQSGHCLVAMMSCILPVECKNITVTLNIGKILREPQMASVNSISASHGSGSRNRVVLDNIRYEIFLNNYLLA